MSAAPGLCGVCVNARIIQSGKGSRFYLCKLSAVDARFPRYPPLPVLECVGFAENLDEEPSQGGGRDSLA